VESSPHHANGQHHSANSSAEARLTKTYPQRFVGDGGTRPSWPGVCDLDPHLPDGGWALQAWIRDYNIVSLHRA
jgi:hypothetical protein